MLVQSVLTEAVLYVLPHDTFINKSVTMSVLLTPKSHSVECLWDFGDASASLHASNTTVAHEYSHPGHYRVQVWFLELRRCASSVWKTQLPVKKAVSSPLGEMQQPGELGGGPR